MRQVGEGMSEAVMSVNVFNSPAGRKETAMDTEWECNDELGFVFWCAERGGTHGREMDVSCMSVGRSG